VIVPPLPSRLDNAAFPNEPTSPKLFATLPAGEHEEISLTLPDKNTMGLREARLFTTWPSREIRYCTAGTEGYLSLRNVCGMTRTNARGIWTATTCRVRVIVKSFYLYTPSSFLFSDGDIA
jgi:hypothetical protein